MKKFLVSLEEHQVVMRTVEIIASDRREARRLAREKRGVVLGEHLDRVEAVRAVATLQVADLSAQEAETVEETVVEVDPETGEEHQVVRRVSAPPEEVSKALEAGAHLVPPVTVVA